MFIDKAKIHASGGRGGNGCLSFRREKYVEMGGPDGGNGGNGGDVWLEADPRKNTLIDLTYRPHYKAGDGTNGRGSNRTGACGEDAILQVPPGTLVYREGKLLADLKKAGERLLAARGGRGGRGNASFKTSVNTAPRISEKGEPGENVQLDLELKLLADAGIVGFPNAGKSTLLARISKARPKIADYPFTTLAPHLGVTGVGEKHFVVADIPGLIEGAHQGKGLGDEFLRHVERTKVLIHIVDVNGFDNRTALQNFRAINRELSAYSPKLAGKPQIVAANKMDLTDSGPALNMFKRHLKKTVVYPVSAATGEGVARLMKAVARALANAPEAPLYLPEHTDYVLEPDFRVEKAGKGLFRVTGKNVDRLVQKTYFEQDEAVARLQKIFRKMGVERELDRIGAVLGDTVLLGDHEFIYRPEKE